jgi:tRNA nucleotidyltransferase (CCA-adding enzyme)
MIDPVINEIIENFIKANLYPTKDERANISTKYNELLEMIPQSTFHMFQSGSYARTTAVTPVDDLDIICDSDNPTTDIALLFKLLQEGYQSKAHVVKQDHSI